MSQAASSKQHSTSADNANLRGTDEFLLLEREIGKLTSLHAEQPDWQQVQRVSAQLLAGSHDLHLCCWHCLSSLQVQGCSALISALQRLTALIKSHWPESYPQRLRGRLAALSWLHGQLASHPHLSNIEEPLHGQLKTCLQQLASALQTAHAEHASHWQQLADQLECPAPPATAQPAVAPVPTTSTQAVASASDNRPLSSERDALQRLRRLQDLAAPLVQWWLSESGREQHALRLMRCLSRASLETVPEHDDQAITQLRPPPAERLAYYHQQITNGDHRQLLHDIENSLRRAPFWLDGHHLAWQCCQALNANTAADEILLQVQQLLRDLPGLEQLKFSDGSPFANAATRQWLATRQESSSHPVETMPPAGTAQPLDVLQREGFAAAASLLQHQLDNQPGERPRVIARLELARIQLHSGQTEQARALLEGLWQQLQHNQALALWEPALLIDTLRLLQQSCASLPRDKTNQLRQQALQQQMVWLDIEHTLKQAARPAMQGEP